MDGSATSMEHMRSSVHSKECGYASGVVIVAMAQYQGVGSTQIDAKMIGIWDKGQPLSRIEKNAHVASFDPGGKTVFRKHVVRR